MAALQARLTEAKGTCNSLKREDVKPAALGPYSEGFRLGGQADKKWATVKQQALAKTGKGLEQYMLGRGVAEGSYERAIASFKKGDGLQRSAGLERLVWPDGTRR